MLLAVANRPIDGNTTFSTGGDVSRFQRRSVPARKTSEVSEASNALNNFAKAIGGGAVGDSAQSGPVVRVSRGNNVTVVPGGAR